MATISREQLVRYIKGLEKKVKDLKGQIGKRDEEITILRQQVSFLQGMALPANNAAAQPEAAPKPAQSPATETPTAEEKPKTEFKKPLKWKDPEDDDKPKSFIKKADADSEERIKELADQRINPQDEEKKDAQVDLEPAASDDGAEGDSEGDGEEKEAAAAPDVFSSSINFEAGEFLSAVLDGEEAADQVKARLEALSTCAQDERRNHIAGLSSLHWQMVAKMGKRLISGDLAWEKRLFMRYGMLDESLMRDRMDIWEQLYLLKDKPDETNVYYIDEWLEAIAKGDLPFSTIDEMALDGQKPDFKATGEKALNYELLNVPSMHRMAVGARANVYTIMMQEYCQPTRDNPIITRAWMRETFPKVKNCDYKMFFRKRKGEEYEVEPLFIVSPGYGQMAGCWEPWSPGRKKDSGPRICMCVFPPRNSMKALLMGVADYRWEYAKADAMHYWLSEGLTGNWLQLFGKKDQRKDLKAIFIENFMLWVLYEARRVPKMDKKFREFFWYNLPFNDEIKQGLKGSGLFNRLLELEEAKKKRDEEERIELERIKAEREARKAAREAKSG